MQSEADRRQNLIDDLLTREKQLNATFKGDSTEPGPSRYEHLHVLLSVTVFHPRGEEVFRQLFRQKIFISEYQHED